jgi:hypothetical protein
MHGSSYMFRHYIAIVIVILSKYRRVPISADSVSAVYSAPKKWKNKEINGSYVSKRAPRDVP